VQSIQCSPNILVVSHDQALFKFQCHLHLSVILQGVDIGPFSAFTVTFIFERYSRTAIFKISLSTWFHGRNHSFEPLTFQTVAKSLLKFAWLVSSKLRLFNYSYRTYVHVPQEQFFSAVFVADIFRFLMVLELQSFSRVHCDLLACRPICCLIS
jgi:hypothetical protein